MKIRELLEAKPGLDLLNQRDLARVVSYRLGKIIRKVNRELADFEEERQKTFRKYARVENNSLTLPFENQEAFAAEIKTLVEEQVDLGEIHKVKLSDLPENLKPSEAIDWLIEE